MSGDVAEEHRMTRNGAAWRLQFAAGRIASVETIIGVIRMLWNVALICVVVVVDIGTDHYYKLCIIIIIIIKMLLLLSSTVDVSKCWLNCSRTDTHCWFSTTAADREV
jgi:hypothetical protein